MGLGNFLVKIHQISAFAAITWFCKVLPGRAQNTIFRRLLEGTHRQFFGDFRDFAVSNVLSMVSTASRSQMASKTVHFQRVWWFRAVRSAVLTDFSDFSVLRTLLIASIKRFTSKCCHFVDLRTCYYARYTFSTCFLHVFFTHFLYGVVERFCAFFQCFRTCKFVHFITTKRSNP